MPLQGPKNVILFSLAFVLVFVVVDHAAALRPWYGLHHITPWNPAVGLSFALIYLVGIRFWPLVILAHVVGYGVVVQTMDVDIVGMPGAVLGCLPYIAAGFAYRWLIGGVPIANLGSLVSFVLICVGAALAAGALHASSLWVSGNINFESVDNGMWRRFVGDLSGVLGVGAFCLLAGTHQRLFDQAGLLLLQIIVIIVTIFVVFGYPNAPRLQLFYLLFLPVLWVALVHGLPGTVVAVVITQLGIVIGGNIAFPPYTGLTAIQALTITLTMTGLFVGMVVTEWRISARRQREQQAALERALRLRSVGEVAAVIGHELNQPLTAISTYAKIAKDALEAGNHESAKAVLDKLIGQSGRASEVILSFRNLLRRGEVNRMPVSLKEMTRELRELIAEECKNRNIVLDVRIPADFPLVEADRVQLQHALLNLLRNSVEAIAGTGKRGEIVLAAEVDDAGRVQITIVDDGPGFQNGFSEVAPTPFLSTKPDGTGLGLAVARTVAEAHGGSFAVLDSRNGAAVRLRLPIKGR